MLQHNFSTKFKWHYMTSKEAVGVTVSVLPQGWHNIKPNPGGFYESVFFCFMWGF